MNRKNWIFKQVVNDDETVLRVRFDHMWDNPLYEVREEEVYRRIRDNWYWETKTAGGHILLNRAAAVIEAFCQFVLDHCPDSEFGEA